MKITRMSKSEMDFTIALAVWIISLLCASVASPLVLGIIVAATTFNLWHERRTLYNAGYEFSRRVNEVLETSHDRMEQRLRKVEQTIGDVRETQIKIAGQFKGRSL